MERKQKIRIIAVIAGIILLVLLLVLGIFYWFSAKEAEKAGLPAPSLKEFIINFGSLQKPLSTSGTGDSGVFPLPTDTTPPQDNTTSTNPNNQQGQSSSNGSQNNNGQNNTGNIPDQNNSTSTGSPTSTTYLPDNTDTSQPQTNSDFYTDTGNDNQFIQDQTPSGSITVSPVNPLALVPPPPDNQCVHQDYIFTPEEEAKLEELTREFYRIAPSIRTDADVLAEQDSNSSYEDLINTSNTMTSECIVERVDPTYTGPKNTRGYLADLVNLHLSLADRLADNGYLMQKFGFLPDISFFKTTTEYYGDLAGQQVDLRTSDEVSADDAFCYSIYQTITPPPDPNSVGFNTDGNKTLQAVRDQVNTDYINNKNTFLQKCYDSMAQKWQLFEQLFSVF